jgi:hypothetical protein
MLPPDKLSICFYGFLIDLLIDSENGDNVFLQNIDLSPYCTLLQPRRPHFSYFLLDYTNKNELGKAVNVVG